MNIQTFIQDKIRSSNLTAIKKAKLLTKVKPVELTESQKWAMSLDEVEMINRLATQKVKFVYTELGEPSEWNSTGMIVAIKKIDDMPVAKIQWEDNEVTKAWLFQFDFLDVDLYLNPEARLKKINDELVIEVNKRRLQNYDRKKQNINEYKSYIADYKKQIALRQADIKKISQTLDVSKAPQDYILNEIELIKKLKTVEDCYISKNKNIIVLTKNLEVDCDGGHYEIGRFVFKIILSGGVLIENRDYGYHEYGHPHLAYNDTCWGNNKTDINQMLLDGNIFALTDFILTFYTTFPHPSGSPHVDYASWLEDRETCDNDSLIEERII